MVCRRVTDRHITLQTSVRTSRINMVSKIFVFFAVLAVSAARRTVRDESSMVSILKDDISKVAEKAKEVGAHISKMLGLESNPLSGEVIQLIKDQTKNFADQAERVHQQLHDELGKLSNSAAAQTFTDLAKKIQETVLSFRQQIESSGMTEKASELQGTFQKGIESIIEETKKVAQNLEPQVTDAGKELENLTKKVLSDAVDNLSQLEGKLHTATGHGGH